MRDTAKDRPNILWICTDQQRWDTLGCYGNPFVKTPNLDRLAAGGVLFETAFCQNPVCAPSRASFLTGRYPRTCRLRQNGQAIPRDEVLITRLLADAGYVCGLSGKLHLAGCRPAEHPQGEQRTDDGYHVFHWSHHPAGENATANHPGNAYTQWLRDRRQTYKISPHPASAHINRGMPEEFHHTTWCAQRAIDFIEAAPAYGRPWLFSVNIFDPHHGFDPPAEYMERYLKLLDEIPLPSYAEGELDHKPSWQSIDHQGAYGGISISYPKLTPRDHRAIRAAYWAMCDLIDVQVGRMLEALETTGQRDNTIVIFTSDHGEMLGDHGIYLKGPYFYEPAVRVPLILSWPGEWTRGARSDSLVELVDLAPTLVEATGLPAQVQMQGRSLAGLLSGQAAPDAGRQDVYCEFYGSNFHYTPRAYTTMIRTRTHKLTIAHGQDIGELYDLAADPGEHRNLWDDPGSQPIKMQLLTRLCDRMAYTVDPLPVRTAPW